MDKPRVLFTGFIGGDGHLETSGHLAMLLDGRIFPEYTAVGRLITPQDQDAIFRQVSTSVHSVAPAAICCLGRASVATLSIATEALDITNLTDVQRGPSMVRATLPASRIASVLSPAKEVRIPQQRVPIDREENITLLSSLMVARELGIAAGLIRLPQTTMRHSQVPHEHTLQLAGIIGRIGGIIATPVCVS